MPGGAEPGLGAALATAAIVAALGALGATPWLRRRLGGGAWVDRPRRDRHAPRPVPRVGGLAWLLGLSAGGALGVLLGLFGFAGSLAVLIVLLGGGLGLLDDRGRVAPLPKAALGLVLLFLLLAVVHWTAVGGSGGAGMSAALEVLIPVAGGVPRFLAVLAASAALHLAFQIFDNLDGVVGATALVGCLHLAAASGAGPDTVGLALLGAGATAGFLVWNAPPASVFLGNAGSQAAGLLTAALLGDALLAVPDGKAALGMVLPFAWPLADLVFVVLRRLRAGRAPWVGGRDHTTHLLAARWGGDRPVFLAVAVSAVFLALLARYLLGSGWGEV